MTDNITAASRIAFAAIIHDLGKLGERARIEIDKETLLSNKHLYCPFNKEKGYHTHVHAAYTGAAIDQIESHLPALTGDDIAPFTKFNDINSDNSLINAAAMHHKPNTLLQWIVATADRVASGFERSQFEQYNAAQDDNHYRSRMLTLFEQINLGNTNEKIAGEPTYEFRYPLKPISVESIFPISKDIAVPQKDKTAQQEYAALWDVFLSGLRAIPKSHRVNFSLWLDHFDSLWQGIAHNIPSATAFGAKADVSLYDHSKAVASIATSLWRYHTENGIDDELAIKGMSSRADWNDEKILLIQGDFFGIQSFIFSGGSDSNKQAAKLLRGRSFYVSLLTECAALKILEALELPSTSQIINAAGKFLIVAPNTSKTKEKLAQVQKELDKWFLDVSYGQSGIGFATVAATCNDFVSSSKSESNFSNLVSNLFGSLEKAKFQRYQLCDSEAPPAIFESYIKNIDPATGTCRLDQRQPVSAGSTDQLSELCRDQIKVGSYLAKPDMQRVLLSHHTLSNQGALDKTIFGYHVCFTSAEHSSGKFGELARKNQLLRVFDISLPKEKSEFLFKGYARRYINAYVPIWDEQASWESDKYKGLEPSEVEQQTIGSLKSFEYLACEDKYIDSNQKWLGIKGLHVLKGDVDNLGAVFEAGLKSPTFAKMASLSRQINNFFTIWLPYYCQSTPQFKNVYTVFAGGDDFFLIGPWQSTMRLAIDMKDLFKAYVADNPELHFSVGMLQCKPGVPVPFLAEQAEALLETAKAKPGKNAVSVYGRTVSWADFSKLIAHSDRIKELRESYSLSTGLIYGLLELSDMVEKANKVPQAALWRSYLSYRVTRFVTDKLTRKDGEQKQAFDDRKARISKELIVEFGSMLEKYKADHKISLFNHLYQVRN